MDSSLATMAYSFAMIISFLLCLMSTLSHSLSPVWFLIPVTKDASTLQYITTLSYGTPLLPTKLVLDLGGPFLWLHCASRNTPSSSSLTTPHRSLQLIPSNHNGISRVHTSIQEPQAHYFIAHSHHGVPSMYGPLHHLTLQHQCKNT